MMGTEPSLTRHHRAWELVPYTDNTFFIGELRDGKRVLVEWPRTAEDATLWERPEAARVEAVARATHLAGA